MFFKYIKISHYFGFENERASRREEDRRSLPKMRSSTSINNLDADSLAYIFAFLPLDERVRVERVCRRWRKVAWRLGWIEFRTLEWDREEQIQRGPLRTFAKYQALIHRCGPHLREFSYISIYNNLVVHWTKMRNLRHLRFHMKCVDSDMLRAVADNLTRLQSIHIFDFDWRDVSGLHDLLRADNTWLQALRLPVSKSLPLRALPSSLRLLHISNIFWLGQKHRGDPIGELLGVAANHCPHLAMLMLPLYLELSELSLALLVQFKKIFYLQLDFQFSHVTLYENLLSNIGAQLRALLLEKADSRVLHLVSKHCPLLEHCSFGIIHYSLEAEGLLSALQSVLQLANLRSLSIRYAHCEDPVRTQILIAITSALKTMGNIEYVHLHWRLLLSIEFITILIQNNPKLRKLQCAIRHDHTPAQLRNLNTLLRNLDRPMDLEFDHCIPPLLEVGEYGNKVRVGASCGGLPKSISQPMLREFWVRAMGAQSVPELGNLDD